MFAMLRSKTQIALRELIFAVQAEDKNYGIDEKISDC